MILRQEDGGTVAVPTKVIRSDGEARVAEALRILEALKFTKKHHLELVTVKLDVHACIQAISDKRMENSYWGRFSAHASIFVVVMIR